MTSSYPQPYTSFSSPQCHLLEWAAPYVVRVAFNRKPVNALSTQLWKEMHRIFQHLHADREVRAIVLNGEGKCFTAGLDLMEASIGGVMDSGTDPARKAFLMRQHIIEFQAAISSIENCEIPVIAAAHSICYGGALDLLSAADVRYAASDCVFSIKEVDVGLAADIGTLQRLPKVIGNHSLARELAYTARAFGAEEALGLGLVSKVVKGSLKEVLAEAVKVAAEIASKSPVAVRSTKINLNYSRDHSVAQGLDYISVWNAAMLQTDDLPVAMAAAMQRKKVDFPKL